MRLPERRDAVERTLERAVAPAHERLVLLVHAFEPALHGVHRLDVAPPLLLELAEQPEDLVGRALEAEVVDRLADHREHRVQRER